MLANRNGISIANSETGQDTPNRSATSPTGTPANTSSTARYLCSCTLSSQSTHERVKHQLKPPRKASSGVGHSS